MSKSQDKRLAIQRAGARLDAAALSGLEYAHEKMIKYVDVLEAEIAALEAKHKLLQAAFDYAYQVAIAYCPECQDKLDAMEGGDDV